MATVAAHMNRRMHHLLLCDSGVTLKACFVLVPVLGQDRQCESKGQSQRPCQVCLETRCIFHSFFRLVILQYPLSLCAPLASRWVFLLCQTLIRQAVVVFPMTGQVTATAGRAHTLPASGLRSTLG